MPKNDKRPSCSVFYEIAVARLQDQMSRIDAADTKVGNLLAVATVLLGLCVALAGYTNLNQVQCSLVFWGLALITYIVISIFAALSYRPREWSYRPDLATLKGLCGSYDETSAKIWVGEECMESLRANEIKLKTKVKWGDWIIQLLPAEAIFLALALLLPLVP